MLEIGLVTGTKRVQMICMEITDRVQAVVGQNKVDLAELVVFDDGKYSVQQGMIQLLVDSSNTADERYSPNMVRREARKLETKDLHDSWKVQYRFSPLFSSDKSDSWIAGKIAKIIAMGRDKETIRKNMEISKKLGGIFSPNLQFYNQLNLHRLILGRFLLWSITSCNIAILL